MPKRGRKGKGIEKKVIELLKKGKTAEEVAKEVYGDTSAKFQNRVRTIAKKHGISYERRKKIFSRIHNYFAGKERKADVEREYRRFKEIYRRLKKFGLKKDKELERQVVEILQKRALKAEKEAKGKKGKFSDVESWSDQDAVCRELADEMYERAKKCFEEGDAETGQKFMRLVAKFLSLSHAAKREKVTEEVQKALAEIQAAATEAQTADENDEGKLAYRT